MREGTFLLSLPLINFWKKKKSLIFHFSLMGVKLRYKGTYLGFLWNVLEPLLTFLILYIVFTSIRERPDNFAIYLLTGIMLFHVFTRGTMLGLVSIRNNENFITSLNIGNEFYPIVSVGSITLTTLVEMGVFLSLLPFLQFQASWTLVIFPVTVLLMLLLVLGLTYFLSILNIFLRDIQPLWAIFAHALFFISPIFWYAENVDGILLDILKFNPVGQIIELAHNLVVFGQISPLQDWLYTSSIVLGILFVGFFLFKKYESRIAEEL